MIVGAVKTEVAAVIAVATAVAAAAVFLPSPDGG